MHETLLASHAKSIRIRGQREKETRNLNKLKEIISDKNIKNLKLLKRGF